MHRLFYIKFYDENGQFIVREDYSGLQFANEQLTEQYIQYQKNIFEVAFEQKLKMNPHHKEVPDIPIKDLIKTYCDVMNKEYSDVISKRRKRDLVDVRMFITKTALKLGYVHGQLRPFFKDGVSYYYETKMDELIESGDIVESLWAKYEEKVMSMLVDFRYEDGSGKLKNNER